MRKDPHRICVFRLDSKHWENIEADLSYHGYRDIVPLIPTVGLLRKRKGRAVTVRVPLLFNYGFMRMSAKRAYDRSFLRKLRQDIPGITSWVNSPEPLFDKKKRRRIDNVDIWDDFSQVATITEEQLQKYMDIAAKNQIFSVDDITTLKIGDYVTLRGYPFDGLGAEIREVHLATKMVDVLLFIGNNSTINVQVPMENVFYSIYQDYDENQFASIEVDFNSDFPDQSTYE